MGLPRLRLRHKGARVDENGHPETQQIAADRITMQSNGDEVDSDAVQFQFFGMGTTGSNQRETRKLMALGKLLQTT